MASSAEMNKLESLNSFFYERLVAVAGEIFQAVKDTFSEYQEEIRRSKQENLRLRKMLAEVSISSRSDSQLTQAEGVSPQNANQGPLDSVVQVKLELCTAQQDAEPQQPAKDPVPPYAVPAYVPEPPHPFSLETLSAEREKVDCSLTDSSSRVETWNSQVMASDDSSLTSLRSDGGHENQSVVVKDDPESKPYSQCRDSYGDFSHLSSHLLNHMTDRSLYCQVCGKSFKYDRLLKAHMVVHQKERPYRCELCGKSYSYAHVLKIHLRTHTGERPYHCKYCGKTFNQKGHVKGHERIHTGEKIYSCSVCGKRFTWLGQGKEHLRVHHDQVATIIRKRKSNC